MKNDETHSVALTFREWMDVCHALGFIQSYYKTEGMKGQANKFDDIHANITEELVDD